LNMEGVERNENISFIKSIPNIKLLSKEINLACKIIKSKIKDNRRIVIKHHNDADGFIGGYALEKSIISYGHKRNIRINLTRYYYSQPSYTYNEALKDWNSLKKDDLLILIDFGSAKSSVLGLNRILYKGINVIIIDHHPMEYKITEIRNRKKFLYINPYLYTQNVDVSAGLISIAISENISFLKNKYLLGLISLYADKLYNTKHYEYMKNKINITDEKIKKYAKVIDFEIFHSSNDYGIINFVLNEKNDEFISHIYNEIIKMENQMISLSKSHWMNKNNVFVIPYNKILLSQYPPPGKLTGVLFEELRKIHGEVVVIGVFNNMLIFRSNDSKMTFEVFYSRISNLYGESYIDGGGHKEAGSIRIVRGIEISPEKILDVIIEG